MDSSEKVKGCITKNDVLTVTLTLRHPF